MDAISYPLLKLLHLLPFVYWLGTDVGVFYSSRRLLDEQLDANARGAVARIMIALDLAPRIAMPLAWPTGLHLAVSGGWLALSGAWVAAAYLVAAAWLGLVLGIHFTGAGPGRALYRADWCLRVIMILLLGGLAVYGLLQPGFCPPWVAWKLLIFAAMVSCGLCIRAVMAPFGPALRRLLAGEADARVNADLRSSLQRATPWVLAIWLGLVVEAALGLHLFGAGAGGGEEP